MAPDEFFTPVPIPSVAINEESFCLNYWRGPVWCNIFFITYKGMKKYGFEKEADCLAGKMLDGVMREWERSGHLWELYDPFGGKAENMEKKYSGPRENARLFAGWTACLLNVIMERPLD
jgi:glycogen debranching enzyme